LHVYVAAQLPMMLPPTLTGCRGVSLNSPNANAASPARSALTQGGTTVTWTNKHTPASKWLQLPTWIQWGPTHPNFTRFFALSMVGHGLMFLTMSIGTTQFLGQFVKSGNPITWWLAKDILPALISVVTVTAVRPERNVARWFVLGYAATNVVMLAEFIAPSLIAAGSQPCFGVLSSLARSMTHLVLQVCRASITEQYALSNNFGAMTRAYSNAGTLAFAVCYGIGLLIAHKLTWEVQLVVMSVSAVTSVACAHLSVSNFAPRKLSVDVVRIVGADFAAAGFDATRYRSPTPEQFHKLHGTNPNVSLPSTSSWRALHAGVDLQATTSSQQHFTEAFIALPTLKSRVAVGADLIAMAADDACAVFEEEATLRDVLATLLLLEHCGGKRGDHAANSHTRRRRLRAVAADVTEQRVWDGRGAALEEALQAAGWHMSTEGVDNGRLRIRCSVATGGEPTR
jgi:hypothetical protein